MPKELLGLFSDIWQVVGYVVAAVCVVALLRALLHGVRKLVQGFRVFLLAQAASARGWLATVILLPFLRVPLGLLALLPADERTRLFAEYRRGVVTGPAGATAAAAAGRAASNAGGEAGPAARTGQALGPEDAARLGLADAPGGGA